MKNLKSTIESILFVTSRPISEKTLAKFLEAEQKEVNSALTELAQERNQSGVILLQSGENWQLATNSENSPAVKNYLNMELREKLTEATVETLSIIAYRQPVSRSEIEAIRGVNSQYSVRHLLIRGLIQKIPNPKDSRQLLYETTIEFLQHMGINNVQELPNFETLVEKIKLPEAPNLQENTEQSSDSNIL